MQTGFWYNGPGKSEIKRETVNITFQTIRFVTQVE